MPARPDACRLALRAHEDARKVLNRFWNLIYAVSVALAGSTVWLIASVLWGNNPSTAVSALATITSGGGLLFIVKLKNDAQKALTSAYEDVKSGCSGPTAAEGGPERMAAPGGEAGLPSYAIDILGESSAKGR